MMNPIVPICRLATRLLPDWTIRARIEGVMFNLSLRDHLFYLVDAKRFEPIPKPQCVGDIMWDIGCSIGLQSARAARLGWRVIAFDISSRNIRRLQETAASNNLAIQAVHAPVVVKLRKFADARTGRLDEQMRDGDLDSIHYTAAALRYGTPKLIKMDIEGGEHEFLNDDPFFHWLDRNRITWIVEVHDGQSRLIGFEEYYDQNHYARPMLKYGER